MGILDAPVLQATPTKSGKVKQTVYNVRDYGAKGDGATDDTTAVTSAITALNAAGGGVLLFPQGGNYVLTPMIQISSNTHIINQGTITLNTAYVVSGTVFKGLFRLGSLSATDIIDNVEIEGGLVVGDCFSSPYTSNSPTFNVNNHKFICYVHSVSTHRNVKVHDVKVSNFGSPVTFEKLGGTNGTPSRNVHVYNIIEDQVWVGCQFYCNGYEYSDCSIHDVTVNFCYDDCVAVVGATGSMSGATGLVQRVQVYNIRGNKSGQVGAFIKLDMTGGILTDISVSNISGYTNGSNSEYFIGMIGGVSNSNKKFNLINVQSQGTWQYGLYAQTSGRNINLTSFKFEALYNIYLQGSQTPNSQQSIRISNGVAQSRNASLANTVEGNGITYSGGNSSQGFQNVLVQNVEFFNKTAPIYEGATLPTGAGVQGTYANFNYDGVDLRDSLLSACTFSANPYRIKYYLQGVYQGENGASFAGAVNMNSHQINNVTDPTSAQDAATKNYVDATAQGLSVKYSVVAMSTSNLTLSGTQTIDGVAVTAGQRVLLNGQTTASQNGIWVVNAGAWTRPTDFAAASSQTGAFVFVEGGTVNASSGWVLAGTAATTVDTTSETWTQFSGAGEITAGSGLAKSGNTLSIENSGVLTIAHGGTGSSTQNFVDLSASQTVGGQKNFSSPVLGTNSATGFDSYGADNFFGTGRTDGVKSYIDIGNLGDTSNVWLDARGNPTNVNMMFRTKGSGYFEFNTGQVGIGKVPSNALDVSGTVAATTFSGSGASLTAIPESAVTNLTTDLAAKYSASNPPPYPVTSVAGHTGAVTLAESDITGLTTDLAAKPSKAYAVAMAVALG